MRLGGEHRSRVVGKCEFAAPHGASVFEPNPKTPATALFNRQGKWNNWLWISGHGQTIHPDSLNTFASFIDQPDRSQCLATEFRRKLITLHVQTLVDPVV